MTAYAGDRVDIRDLGAMPTTTTLQTAAIQAAVDGIAEAGGGTVHVPPGTFLTGGIELRSHVTLELADGATLLGSTDLADYPPHAGPEPDADAGQRHLIFARGAEHVAITGRGTIDGQGPAFWEPRDRPPFDPAEQWHEVIAWRLRPRGENARPSPMVELVDCRHVRVEGVTLRDSPGWTLHVMACDTVTVRDVVVRNPVDGPNTDGIDLSCSSNVMVSGCDIETGDDAICLKSFNPYGDVLVSRNVLVTGCRLSTCCNGFKIGTGTEGGFEGVVLTDSVIRSEDRPVRERMIAGLAVEMVDGGWIDGFTAVGIRMERVRTPIFVRLGNRGTGRAAPTPGRLENVRICDVQADDATFASSITGLAGHPVRGVTLRDVRIATAEHGLPEWATAEVPGREADYPEAFMLGRLPAYGLYCRHVEELDVAGLTVVPDPPEGRPLLVGDHVRDVELRDVGGAPATLVDLRDSHGVLVDGAAAAVAPPEEDPRP